MIRDEYKAKMARIKEEFKIACNSPHSKIKEVSEILENLHQTLLEIGTDVYQQKNAGMNNSSESSDLYSTNASDNDLVDRNSIRAVVSVSDSAQIEGVAGLDFDEDLSSDDYESVD